MIGAKTIKIGLVAFVAAAFAVCGTANAKDDKDDQPKSEKNPGVIGKMFGSQKDNPGPCPLLGVLYDASRMVEFKAPEERMANVGFTGEITGVRGLCVYSGTAPIDANMDIDMAFGRGPMADGETRVYRYWVAVTRTNVGPLAKQYFDVPVKFEKGAQRVFHTEHIKRISIPRANKDVAGTAFEILVGFELTPEQLAFNRAGKRFKMTASPTGN